jgi:hypothetical protein
MVHSHVHSPRSGAGCLSVFSFSGATHSLIGSASLSARYRRSTDRERSSHPGWSAVPVTFSEACRSLRPSGRKRTIPIHDCNRHFTHLWADWGGLRRSAAVRSEWAAISAGRQCPGLSWSGYLRYPARTGVTPYRQRRPASTSARRHVRSHQCRRRRELGKCRHRAGRGCRRNAPWRQLPLLTRPTSLEPTNTG